MSQTVEAAGVELAYEVQGAGPAVLLVHDAAADRRAWAGLIGALAGTARTIAYDRRGYGDSGAPEPYERTTVQEQAEDAAALLAALAGGSAGDAPLACGAGFGALVVLDLLVRRPGLLRGAVLVEPPVNQLSATAAEALSQQRDQLEAALRDGGPGAAVAAWRPDADDAVRAAYRAFFADFAGLASWPVSRRELRAVAVPVALVTGPATPRHVREATDALAALLPHARRDDGGDPLPALHELLGR